MIHGPLAPDIDVVQSCGHRHCYSPNHLKPGQTQYEYLIESVKLHNDLLTCLEWPFSRYGLDGKKLPYGRVPFDDTEDLVHRVSFTLFVGPIPDGINVCHSCDNPPCYNPSHLWLGDDSANQQDASLKGRQAGQQRTGENHPMHRLTADTVLLIRKAGEAGVSIPHLAEQFSISYEHVRHIILRKRWKHI